MENIKIKKQLSNVISEEELNFTQRPDVTTKEQYAGRRWHRQRNIFFAQTLRKTEMH